MWRPSARSSTAREKLRLLDAATVWVHSTFWATYRLKLPASPRQAVVMALLRARALQGCSRQLSSLAEVLATNRNTQDSPAAQIPQSSLITLSSECNLVGVLGKLVCLLCQVHMCIPRQCRQDDTGSVEKKGVRVDAEEPVVKQEGGERQEQHGAEDGGREQGGMGEGSIQQQQQQQQQQAHGAAGPGAVPQTERHPDLLQEMLSEIRSSGVLEHLSRCVLLLAGRLQGVGEAGEGQAQGEQGSSGEKQQPQQQQQQQHYQQRLIESNETYLETVVFYAGDAYRILSSMTQHPGLLDGDCCSPADPGSGRPGAGHDMATGDEDDTAPLGTVNLLQSPTQVSLLRRVLFGPCIRHLVLCAGLNALSALDGGSTYGIPEGAGLQRLVPILPPSPSEQEEQQQDQMVRLNLDSLLNLLTLLAMRPCDPEAEPPGRAMRLRLTLRVARAAVAAVSASSTGRPQDGPQCYLQRGDAATVAVQALHSALRHMPPPGDGEGDGEGDGRGSHSRLQALRRWAALAEAVARNAAPERNSGCWSEKGDVGHRLGLLLGLDPRLVRPETPGDLPALASGGHLLRGVEALVRHCVEKLEAEEQEQQGATSAEEAYVAGPAARALMALSARVYYAPDVWMSPLAHLLLLRGDDEPLDGWMAGQGGREAGYGQREGQDMREAAGEGGWASSGPASEAVGRGPGCLGQGQTEAGRGPRGLRADASLAVALGKLLWRCEGRLAWYVAVCSKVGDARASIGGVTGLLHVAGEVCVLDTGYTGLRSADYSGDGGAGGSEAGMGGGEYGAVGRGTFEAVEQQEEQQQEQQQQQEQLAQQRRQVWVCAFAAWRWLPPLASLAGRTAAEGHVPLRWDHLASVTWQPLVWWTRIVCFHHLCPDGAPAREAGAGAGSCQEAGGGDDGGTVGCSSSSSCRGGACAGRWCGCWRDFLLRDVEVVELVGTALREVVPALALQPPLGGCTEGGYRVVAGITDACVLLAAAFPEEVARAAGRLSSDGSAAAATLRSGGSGGSCARPSPSSESSSGSSSDIGASASANASTSVAVWPPCGLARLAQLVSQLGNSEVMVRALRLLEAWCGACGEAGGPVGFDEEQRAVLRSAAAFTAQCSLPLSMDAAMLPPLCELRGLLRVCSNPRCAVLPPPGQTEAEAAEKAGAGPEARLEACSGGRGVAWYCCRECREEHGRARDGRACRGGAVPA